jgi:hypothetical protein
MQACGVLRRTVACDSAQQIVSWIACQRAAGCHTRSRRSCSRAAPSAGSSAKFSPSAFVVCVMSGGLVDSTSRSAVGETRSVPAVVGLLAKPSDTRSYPRHRALGTRCRLLSDRPPPARVERPEYVVDVHWELSRRGASPGGQERLYQAQRKFYPLFPRRGLTMGGISPCFPAQRGPQADGPRSTGYICRHTRQRPLGG